MSAETATAANVAFTVRLATPDDAAAVSALLAACYPVFLAGHYDTDLLDALLPRMTQASPALLASGSYYLAEASDGTVIGCGGWTRERPGTGEVTEGLGHVRHVGVHPAWAGRGVGRALFERWRKQARACGIREFECYATLNAEGFYNALGFETEGPLEVDMGPGPKMPSMLMRQAIA